MEFLRGSQHGSLYLIPQLNSGLTQTINHAIELLCIVLLLEMVLNNRTKDLFDRSGQDHIENEEVALRPVGDVVFTTSGMLHCSEILQLLDALLLSDVEPLKHIEASVLD